MAQVRKDGGCWGQLRMRCGWTGDTGYQIGHCDKKPRAGRLTCWSHRAQEYDAQRLKKDYDAEQEEMSKTCFHCGDPAMPETHGLDPRCERHRDIP